MFTRTWRKGGTGLPIRTALGGSLLAGCAFLCVANLAAQTPSLLPATPALPPQKSSDPSPRPNLPDAPGRSSAPEDVLAVAQRAEEAGKQSSPTLGDDSSPIWQTASDPGFYRRMQRRRAVILSNQRFLNTEISLPMTSRQKAYIAATDVIDPGNLAVIAVSSAIYIASNAHTAYGPGPAGFGRNYGYSLAQDVTGEALGTWLIPSIAHHDPRYHRMPGAPVRKRIFHALAHTVITQSDSGSAMPNYATLLTYPLAAAAANLYVPGLQRDLPSTTQRVLIGLASDPSDALIGEFLPDVARRIHIRVTFFQQVINDISTDHP